MTALTTTTAAISDRLAKMTPRQISLAKILDLSVTLSDAMSQAQTRSYQRANLYPYHALKQLVTEYIPELLSDDRMKKVRMDLFRQATQCPRYDKPNYQKLEFVGDAAYQLVITEYLIQRFPDKDPGFITKLRIRLERGDTMALLATRIGLAEYIQDADELTDKILEDVFEAFVAAFHFMLGYTNTKILIIALAERFLDIADILEHDDNYKGVLLSYFHQKRWGDAKYRSKGGYHQVCDAKGNRYGEKVFHKDTKEGEKLAAKSALLQFGVMEGDYVVRDWLAKVTISEEVLLGEVSDSEDSDQPRSPSKQTLPAILNPNNKLLTKPIISKMLAQKRLPHPVRVTHYKIAMCHSSYLKRENLSDEEKAAGQDCVPMQRKSNLLLRLLGSSMIHYAIGYFVYDTYPGINEGMMTVYRTRLEHKNTLAHFARRCGITEYLLIARDVEKNQDGRNRESIVRGCLEAFVGAIYLDQGVGVAYLYVCKLINSYCDLDQMEQVNTNYKGELAEKIRKQSTIQYSVQEETGPDHDKMFSVLLRVDGKRVSEGTGSTKKDAQQQAAQRYLWQLKERE